MHEVKNITTTPEVLKLIADIDEFKGLSGENQVPSASSGQVLAELSARLGMTFFPGAYKFIAEWPKWDRLGEIVLPHLQP